MDKKERKKNWWAKNPGIMTKYNHTRKARHPEAYIAQESVHNAIRRGEIERGDCAVCGAAGAQAHHPDYSQPLNVVWLCAAHHREEHKRIRGAV